MSSVAPLLPATPPLVHPKCPCRGCDCVHAEVVRSLTPFAVPVASFPAAGASDVDKVITSPLISTVAELCSPQKWTTRDRSPEAFCVQASAIRNALREWHASIHDCPTHFYDNLHASLLVDPSRRRKHYANADDQGSTETLFPFAESRQGKVPTHAPFLEIPESPSDSTRFVHFACPPNYALAGDIVRYVPDRSTEGGPATTQSWRFRQMNLMSRYVRRILRCGGRSPIVNILYATLFLVMISLVTTQLSDNNGQGNLVPKPKQNGEMREPLDLHSLIKNRQEKDAAKIADRKVLEDIESAVAKSLPNSANLEPVHNSILVGGQVRMEKPRPAANTAMKVVHGERYPRLTSEGSFVPIRRFIHLDLKGAPYKVSFFAELFSFLNRLQATGVLIEWEDMFPYEGRLKSAVNGNAYSMQHIETILKTAREHRLEVVPLVQTFGHLEWILKLEEFAHLREDPKFPQVICFGAEESWNLLRDMVNQVANVHKKFGMPFFHMGADEAFQIGTCNATVAQMAKQGSRDRVMLWHMARTADYIRKQHNVTVLAWHDMFGHVMEEDLKFYNMTEVLEPVLWSYAEDLEQYLPYSSWFALKPFKNVWGSSAFKGADGPSRFHSNPIHYIRNHESWVVQMNRVYKEFDVFQGMIITGWSRYDHLAVLAELLPVGIPSLATGMETILTGKPLRGDYPRTAELLQCTVPVNPGYVLGCQFPGHRIYEIVNELKMKQDDLAGYLNTDHEVNGWLSRMAEAFEFSSPMYIDKILPYIDFHLQPMERLQSELRTELSKIYFDDLVEEFLFTYVNKDVEFLQKRRDAAKRILERKYFAKRPFF
ncbi:hypothetical protein QR680_012796 [Steinernema hermaphroditum]|uniref:beta-N-acetylhexosaminidase n=1 Tax=Steinernema hermaphroditum TaxID=289476 RepID=A0AA39M1E0_9BILA|nr:hypothetical protein QR680_012796 [Steinernema hermaphroditum]